MNILIPMAGAGQRFADAGYKVSKPAIPTTDRKDGRQYPMVVCAVKDLPNVSEDGSNILFIDRDFHKTDGVEEEIRAYFPGARFLTLSELTEGQACTCLLAEEWFDNDSPLLIAGCDNGMEMDYSRFQSLTDECDVLAFTFRGHEMVLKNPDAYGWMRVEDPDGDKITGVSIKKSISDQPMNDHAIVATFWFKRGSDFFRAARKMIAENDRVNGEFYVDTVMKHCLELGLDTRVFEIKRYIGWGTPKDYEEYEATLAYWREYTLKECL